SGRRFLRRRDSRTSVRVPAPFRRAAHPGTLARNERRRSEMSFNLAARAGRWSAGRWKTALAGWLGFCVVAVALGSVAGTKMLKQKDTAAGETKRAEQILDRAGFPNHAGESVLIESKTQTLADP